jgi:hypothetical protein
MKYLLLNIFLTSFVFITNTGNCQKSIHKIILSSGEMNIDTVEVKTLKESLKGLLALYSAMGGSNCDGETCDLTTALGLGAQGSNAHKALILKYFPDDKVARAVLAQNCYLRPGGASTFTEYNYLTISESRDTVRVYYEWLYYDHGATTKIKGPDVYIFHDNKYKMLKRKLWSRYDK